MLTSDNFTRNVFGGDSITSLNNLQVGNWPGVPGSFIDQARALQSIGFEPLPQMTFVPGRIGQTAPALYQPATQRGRRQVMCVYGVGGRTVAGLAADLQASVYVWQPTNFILEIGTNDFGGGTDVTPNGAFQTSYNQVLDGVHANFPNCRILCLTPPIRAESWVAAGPHLTDGLDTWAGITRIQESVAARSWCEFCDITTPAFALTRILQPVAASSVAQKYLTVDSLHPTQLGRLVIAQAVLAHFQWS